MCSWTYRGAREQDEALAVWNEVPSLSMHWLLLHLLRSDQSAQSVFNVQHFLHINWRRAVVAKDKLSVSSMLANVDPQRSWKHVCSSSTLSPSHANRERGSCRHEIISEICPDVPMVSEKLRKGYLTINSWYWYRRNVNLWMIRRPTNCKVGPDDSHEAYAHFKELIVLRVPHRSYI